MTQRERYLAIGVGALLLIVVLNFVFKGVVSSLHQKEDLVDQAFSNLQSLDSTILTGTRATNLLRVLESKSLPSLQEAAEAQYKSWLYDLAEKAGLEQIRVVAQGRPQPVFPVGQPMGTPKAFDVHEFSLSGNCQLPQALDLLAHYYDRDYLQQISSLKLIPTNRPNQFRLELTSRAVSMAKASAKKEPSLSSSGRLAMSLEDYRKTILARNPLAAPNKPPAFKTRPSHDVPVGKPWQLALEASDPEGNSIQYEIVGNDSPLPPTLSLENGQLKWHPQEKGEQKVVLRAIDDGMPAESSQITLTLRAVDPPPPPEETPSLDPARQAFLTGLVTGRSGAQGWIRSRTEDVSIDIYEGAEIQIGTISARVVKIHVSQDFVELETDGMRWTVDMNTSLAEAYQKSQVD